MQGSTRCICKFSHHLKQPMICCDKCAKWQHANCMGITPQKFAEYNKCKDLQYHCEKCEPRFIDEAAARKYQEELLRASTEAKTSTDTASTDDDDIAKQKEERKSSRDDRKTAQLEKLFEKMEHSTKGRRRTTVQKKEELEEDEDEGSDEDEPKAVKPKSGKRGRPKGSGNKRRLDDEPETTVKRPRPRKPRETRNTDSPGPVEAEASTSSTRSTRQGRKGRPRRPGRPRPAAASQPETTTNNEPEGSDTEDSADSGLVEECEVVNLTVPLRNPYVRRRLDISKFENVKSFGQDVTITFHDWEWRGGNNSKVIKKESDTWTSSLGKNGSGHFKKQWLMKNSEETKEVPDVNEIIREELRKRNVDLTKIPELNENGEQPVTTLPVPETPKDDNSDRSSQKSDNSQPIWQPAFEGTPPPATNSTTSPTDSNASGTPRKPEEKTSKKLSMAEYLARNKERKKREDEEKARLEAERQKQQESRLSNDAVTAVLSSAIGAATNGSKVCDINADDIAWLSHLVGINLNNSQPAAELPIETTAERLSRLYHTSEQVLNTMRAANVLAALTAQQNMK